jgi:anti-sigma factor RsiW
MVYKRMMTHDDFRQQLPDYALSLLSPQQLGLIEDHIAHCDGCRKALLKERKVGRLVYSTIHNATQPDSGRLRSLMPVPRASLPACSPWNRRGWQKQLAPVILILMLAFGVFLTQRTLPAGGSFPGFVGTAYAATATSTNTPTATAVQSLPVGQTVPELETLSSVPNQPAPSKAPDHPVTTPEPLPPSVASVRQLLVQ